MGFEVETISVDERATAIGSAGPFTLVVDRPPDAGGRGLGFNGGQLLNLAVAGCVSNDLYREAARLGIDLQRVRITARSDYGGSPTVSGPIELEVEVEGNAPTERLAELIHLVDRVAEIPNSLRAGTEVRLAAARANGSPVARPS